jgi:L-ascorbate metabolism protein UlaG (beta-lactamase superfamily)
MKLTYYGHACFAVETGSKNILFDPFITPNEGAKHINVEDIRADYILLSHGHGDHTTDCAQIAKKNNATVVAAFEVAEWADKQGINNTHPMNTGGKWVFDFGVVKCVNAVHSSVMPDGACGATPMGFVVTTPEKSFYYSGDTALTMDMQLIPRWAKLDFCVLCIGDNFTMGYEDAVEAARMVQCNTVVGVHFDTFGYIKIDHQKAIKAFADAGKILHLLELGASIDL